MPVSDDSVTLQEVARTLADFRAEFRGQLQQLVRTDVYRAEQAADRARIAVLEKRIESDDADKLAARRGVQMAVVGAIASAVASPLLALLVALAVHK